MNNVTPFPSKRFSEAETRKELELAEARFYNAKQAVLDEFVRMEQLRRALSLYEEQAHV